MLILYLSITLLTFYTQNYMKKETGVNCWVKLYNTTTVWPKWQIVIPKEVRDLLNLEPWDSLAVLTQENRFIGLVRNQDINELMEYIKTSKK